MTATLGADWRSFFDLAFCYCCKPAFFTDKKRPLYLMDQSVPNWQGKEIKEAKDLIIDSQVTYLEGNCHILHDYLRDKLGREPRFCYLGDQYTSDAHHASTVDNWHSIVVMEELSFATDEYHEIEESSPLGRVDLNLINYSKYWGECYFTHNKSEPKKNYFVQKVSESARYAVPLIKHISHLMDDMHTYESPVKKKE